MVRARPLIPLQSVQFFYNYLKLGNYSYSETPYPITIRLIFKHPSHVSLSLTLWSSKQRLDRDPLFDYNPSQFCRISLFYLSLTLNKKITGSQSYQKITYV